MLMSIICIILTGVNYLAFKVPLVGVAFIIVTVSFIISFFVTKWKLKIATNNDFQLKL